MFSYPWPELQLDHVRIYTEHAKWIVWLEVIQKQGYRPRVKFILNFVGLPKFYTLRLTHTFVTLLHNTDCHAHPYQVFFFFTFNFDIKMQICEWYWSCNGNSSRPPLVQTIIPRISTCDYGIHSCSVTSQILKFMPWWWFWNFALIVITKTFVLIILFWNHVLTTLW